MSSKIVLFELNSASEEKVLKSFTEEKECNIKGRVLSMLENLDTSCGEKNFKIKITTKEDNNV